MKCMPVLFLSQMQLLVVLICIFISLVHLCNSLATNGNALKSVLAKHTWERLLKLIETRTIKIIPKSRENSKLIMFRWIPHDWNQVQKYQAQLISWCALFKPRATMDSQYYFKNDLGVSYPFIESKTSILQSISFTFLDNLQHQQKAE